MSRSFSAGTISAASWPSSESGRRNENSHDPYRELLLQISQSGVPAHNCHLVSDDATPSEIGGSVTAERVKDVVALLILLAGLALRATVIGYAYIQRGGLKKRVYASDLVTEGMFGSAATRSMSETC